MILNTGLKPGLTSSMFSNPSLKAGVINTSVSMGFSPAVDCVNKNVIHGTAVMFKSVNLNADTCC